MTHKKNLYLVFIGLLVFFGCSSNKEITQIKVETKNEIDRTEKDYKKKAMDHFINGSIAEAKVITQQPCLSFRML